MGAVNTTYTFTATDTITSTKMNNIIDETVMTADAVLGGSGGSGGLDIASGKLSISANAINNSRLGSNSVTSDKIADGTIVDADINASAAIAGTKISPSFGNQTVTANSFRARGGTPGSNGANNNGYSFSAPGDNDSGMFSSADGTVEFYSNNTERMRIATNGDVGIGTGAPSQKLDVNGTTKSTKLVIDNTSNDDKVFIKGFNNNNTDDGIRFVPSIVTSGNTAAACSFMAPDGTTLRGTISILTTGVNYGSSSDYRLKSDVVPISEALQQLQQLNPVNFEWVENGERSDGFIAHEVQAVVPNAVTGAKDAVDANGNPIYQQVDYSKLVPILVASAQELSRKVAELESR